MQLQNGRRETWVDGDTIVSRHAIRHARQFGFEVQRQMKIFKHTN